MQNLLRRARSMAKRLAADAASRRRGALRALRACWLRDIARTAHR